MLIVNERKSYENIKYHMKNDHQLIGGNLQKKQQQKPIS